MGLDSVYICCYANNSFRGRILDIALHKKDGRMEEQIEQFITYLQQSRELSGNTVLSYRRDLGQLKRYLEIRYEIRDLGDVTAGHLEAYFDMLGQRQKASTVSRHMTSVRALYRYLAKRYLVKEDITEHLQTPRQRRAMPEVLTVEEIETLMEQPSGDKPVRMRDRAILELMYATGIKVSELVELKVSDLNLRLGFLHCGENGRERVVPFGNSARGALLQYMDRGREQLLTHICSQILFLNYNGSAMSRQGVWKLVCKYGKQAGIQKEVTPHSLRHAFAAHLIENGADLRSVQEMMGHTDLAATQIYAAAYRNKVRDEYTRIHPRG